METRYIYVEGNEDNVEGENIKEVFADYESACAFLRERVLGHYGGCRWDELKDVIAKDSYCCDPDAITVREDYVSDGEYAFWAVYERKVRSLPKDMYGTKDIGQYMVSADGLSYDNGRPYLNMKIFKFEGEKPANGGRPAFFFYASFGDLDWIPDDERFLKLLMEKYKNSGKVDLCSLYDEWQWKKTWYR